MCSGMNFIKSFPKVYGKLPTSAISVHFCIEKKLYLPQLKNPPQVTKYITAYKLICKFTDLFEELKFTWQSLSRDQALD